MPSLTFVATRAYEYFTIGEISSSNFPGVQMVYSSQIEPEPSLGIKYKVFVPVERECSQIEQGIDADAESDFIAFLVQLQQERPLFVGLSNNKMAQLQIVLN